MKNEILIKARKNGDPVKPQADPPVNPEKNIPLKPDKNPDTTKIIPNVNEPTKIDPTRIDKSGQNILWPNRMI